MRQPNPERRSTWRQSKFVWKYSQSLVVRARVRNLSTRILRFASAPRIRNHPTCLSEQGRLTLTCCFFVVINIITDTWACPLILNEADGAHLQCIKATLREICGMMDVVRFGLQMVPHIKRPRGALVPRTLAYVKLAKPVVTGIFDFRFDGIRRGRIPSTFSRRCWMSAFANRRAQMPKWGAKRVQAIVLLTCMACGPMVCLLSLFSKSSFCLRYIWCTQRKIASSSLWHSLVVLTNSYHPAHKFRAVSFFHRQYASNTTGRTEGAQRWLYEGIGFEYDRSAPRGLLSGDEGTS